MSRPLVAKSVLDRIEECLQADQGAAFRQWEQRVLPHIGDAYRGHDDPFREHLGASVLGRDCGREVWYGYHWSAIPTFPGRVLRLFNRGHLEEGRFISLLLMIGAKVFQQDENGKQFRISHRNGLMGGSGDGKALNLPGLEPDQMAVLEFKTHNDKSYKKLVEVGVKEAKFEHYVQMQVYMFKMGIPVSLYMAVNKNDDDIYAEWVRLDSETAEEFLRRGERILDSERPPRRLNKSPGYYKCRFCDYKKICHFGVKPAVNCRTCQHSKIVLDVWTCTKFNFTLKPKDPQGINPQQGCQSYELSEAFNAD